MSGFERFFSPAIKEMIECQNRVAMEHAGASVTHNLSYLFSHIRFEAVDGAFCTGSLTFLKGTCSKALQRVIK